jgi:hypothetical protein
MALKLFLPIWANQGASSAGWQLHLGLLWMPVVRQQHTALGRILLISWKLPETYLKLS